jgi:hypothetical protein
MITATEALRITGDKLQVEPRIQELILETEKQIREAANNGELGLKVNLDLGCTADRNLIYYMLSQVENKYKEQGFSANIVGFELYINWNYGDNLPKR